MAGLTQPLEFRRFLVSAPRAGFDFVPFLDAVLIVLFVALNTSLFVIAPGTRIRLPESPAMESSPRSPTAVLTVDQNELYFFGGRKLSSLSLQAHLNSFVKEVVHDGSGPVEATLLIKADASLPSRSLFALMDMARQAGFTEIHLASEAPRTGQAGPWKARNPIDP